MSKTKTKRARRELKREETRKAAAQHRKASKPTSAATSKAPNAKKSHAKTSSKPQAQAAPKAPMQASQRPEVPFGQYDNILLVGEGDFSFTRSLVIDHGCANVTATSYDSLADVQSKYPTFTPIQEELTSLTPPVPIFHSIDATKISSYKQLRCMNEDGDVEEKEGRQEHAEGEGTSWDTIAFMFPHTGGLSTDVNRQVRANQALLVDFFKSCIEAEQQRKERIQRLKELQNSETKDKNEKKNQDKKKKPQRKPFLKPHGKILLTLFEGEPYTLWNARDLARHAGLRVVQSFKFDWTQYPAYKHVRTLGAIEGGGAWKGEERDARMFVFEKVPLEPDSEEEREVEKLKAKRKKMRNGSGQQGQSQGQGQGKKRARDESDSEDD